jgi:hypothetical protein
VKLEEVEPILRELLQSPLVPPANGTLLKVFYTAA